MKVRLNVLLNAPEDYSCGDCKKCPIHQESYYSTHQFEEIKISCPLGYNSVSCPLEQEDITTSKQLRSMGELPKLQPHPPAYEKRGLIK